MSMSEKKKAIVVVSVSFLLVGIFIVLPIVLLIFYDSTWFTNNIRGSVKHPDLFTNEKLIYQEDGPVLNLNGDQSSTGIYKFTPSEINLLLSDENPFNCEGADKCYADDNSFTWWKTGGITKDIYVDKQRSIVEVGIDFW